MKALTRFALLILLAAPVIITAAGTGQKIVVKMSDKSGRHTFTPGASKHSVPKSIIEKAEKDGKSPPQIAVKSGDTLVFTNSGTVFCRPFSALPGNKFQTPKAGIKPGGSISFVVRNTGKKPIVLGFYDEIHTYVKLNIVVLPAGKMEEDDAKDAVVSGLIDGDWDTDYGPPNHGIGHALVLKRTGDVVTGTLHVSKFVTIKGKFESDGKAHITWEDNQYGRFNYYGAGTLWASPDGKTLYGTWWYLGDAKGPYPKPRWYDAKGMHEGGHLSFTGRKAG